MQGEGLTVSLTKSYESEVVALKLCANLRALEYQAD